MITHERIFRSHCLTKEWNNAMLKKALRTGVVENKRQSGLLSGVSKTRGKCPLSSWVITWTIENEFNKNRWSLTSPIKHWSDGAHILLKFDLTETFSPSLTSIYGFFLQFESLLFFLNLERDVVTKCRWVTWMSDQVQPDVWSLLMT